MNPVESYKIEHGLTYQEMAKMAGFRSHNTVRNHAYGIKPVSAESAVQYETHLGIPRSELRPDLWPPAGSAVSGSSPSAKPIGSQTETFSPTK